MNNNTGNKPSSKINFQKQIHLTARGEEKEMTVTYKHVMYVNFILTW